MFDLIMDLLKEAWDWIKKVWVKIVNFFKNIVGWFQNPQRLKKLKEDKNLTAVSIKQKLDNGDYQTIKCLFDEASNEIKDAEVITSESLDNETLQNFGNKDMIVLK